MNLFDFCDDEILRNELKKAVFDLKKICIDNNFKISCAESCTGGLCGAAITSVNGSSSFFNGGFITYTNEMKMNLLGVKNSTIEKFTEVSEECALEMASGANVKSLSDASFSITGYAGSVQSFDEEIIKSCEDGKICFGFYGKIRDKEIKQTWTRFFDGTRDQIRLAAAVFIISQCNSILKEKF